MGLGDVGSGISGEGSRIIGVRPGIRITVVGSGWDLVEKAENAGNNADSKKDLAKAIFFVD